MPLTDEIIAGLSSIANEWRLLAILWHAFFSVLVLGLVVGARPSSTIVGILLSLPLFSVSILAWVQGNLFNGAAFALVGLILLTIAVQLVHDKAKVVPGWTNVFGWLMIGLGWVYPHFLERAAFWEYLYAAPTGLIPCPTLSIAAGFTLVLGGLGSRLWCLVLSAFVLFYGVFGIAILRVNIDGALVLGAFVLAYVAFSPRVLGDYHAAVR